ncbi:MAG: vWA domain-containing protein [Cyclobacteriaceae bacterium]
MTELLEYIFKLPTMIAAKLSQIMQWAWPSLFSDSPTGAIEWENPILLLLIYAIPIVLLLRWLFDEFFSQKLPSAFPRGGISWSPLSLMRFLPTIAIGFVLLFLVTAMARPQIHNEQVDQWTEGIDIVLVVDISTSMQIQDFKPNRLEAAKNAARDFINGRVGDRIGMVIFSGEAYSLAPLTTDYDLLHTYIDDISFNKISTNGTAIGSAIGVGINRMRESESKTKVMILLSDGDNNAGNIDPISAADLAQAFDIKIYTIGIGREGRVPIGKDIWGRTEYSTNTLDETTLRKIADIGNGEFYRVSNNQALEEVFARIDQYEKVEIKESRYTITTDLYHIYLTWAIAFFLLWLFMKATFISNALED